MIRRRILLAAVPSYSRHRRISRFIRNSTYQFVYFFVLFLQSIFTISPILRILAKVPRELHCRRSWRDGLESVRSAWQNCNLRSEHGLAESEEEHFGWRPRRRRGPDRAR